MSASQTPYVNFKVLRKGLSFEAVLKHYHVEVKRQPKGNRHVGFCPLPTHQGKRRSPSFSAKLDWGVWQCFGCKASGNVLDFAVRMEGFDPTNHHDLRQVALMLQEAFRVPGAGEPSIADPKVERKDEMSPARKFESSALSAALPSVVTNPPLDFELKNLDPEHPYLRERGFTPETIRHFGLGYCNRGLMKGRFVIPLHDAGNNLVGYAGRLVDDSLIDECNPKYKLPGSRKRDGRLLEFKSSRLVYNANRLSRPTEDIVVVEGFSSVWWLTQHGHPHVVALMGSNCSEEQAKILVSVTSPSGRVWILPDGDPAGITCAHSVFTHLSPHRLVRWAKLTQGQPTDCKPAYLHQILPAT